MEVLAKIRGELQYPALVAILADGYVTLFLDKTYANLVILQQQGSIRHCP